MANNMISQLPSKAENIDAQADILADTLGIESEDHAKRNEVLRSGVKEME